MNDFSLPRVAWFTNGNVYNGSCGADPLFGGLRTTVLRYRLQAAEDDGEKKLCLTYRVAPPFYDNTPPEEQCVWFALSDDGITEAKAHITQAAKGLT